MQRNPSERNDVKERVYLHTLRGTVVYLTTLDLFNVAFNEGELTCSDAVVAVFSGAFWPSAF
jgi:hypothetical protein